VRILKNVSKGVSTDCVATGGMVERGTCARGVMGEKVECGHNCGIRVGQVICCILNGILLLCTSGAVVVNEPAIVIPFSHECSGER